jgi:hypothetical protein
MRSPPNISATFCTGISEADRDRAARIERATTGRRLLLRALASAGPTGSWHPIQHIAAIIGSSLPGDVARRIMLIISANPGTFAADPPTGSLHLRRIRIIPSGAPHHDPLTPPARRSRTVTQVARLLALQPSRN